MNLGQIPPSILYSLKNQPLKWATALAELIDNALDAKSSQVKVNFESSSQISVTDDGVGCDNIEKMLTLGVHMRIPGGGYSLGMYGIGLKDAACWLWGELKIKTRRGDTIREARIHWDTLAKSATWDVPDPVIIDSDDEFYGTKLVFRNITRRTSDYERLGSELSWVFSPALAAGRQIKLLLPRRKEIICSAWVPPPRENLIQDQFLVNGKSVRIDVGVVVIGHQNTKPGFTFSYKHRNIQCSALGSKGHSVARICGIVTLDAAWSPSKNKTEIVDDQDALEDAIWERCERIIISAAEQAMLLNNTQLESQVNERLQEILGKAKRNKGETEGTVQPKNTNRKHRKAKKTQTGDGLTPITSRRRGAFSIAWPQKFSDKTLGDVDFPGGVINLNPSHPFLAALRDDENVNGIVSLALSLLSYYAITNDAQKRMPLFAKLPGDYGGVLGELLSTQEVSRNENHKQEAELAQH